MHGIIVEIYNKVFIKLASGELKELQIGDFVNLDEVIFAQNAAVKIKFDDEIFEIKNKEISLDEVVKSSENFDTNASVTFGAGNFTQVVTSKASKLYRNIADFFDSIKSSGFFTQNGKGGGITNFENEDITNPITPPVNPPINPPTPPVNPPTPPTPPQQKPQTPILQRVGYDTNLNDKVADTTQQTPVKIIVTCEDNAKPVLLDSKDNIVKTQLTNSYKLTGGFTQYELIPDQKLIQYENYKLIAVNSQNEKSDSVEFKMHILNLSPTKLEILDGDDRIDLKEQNEGVKVKIYLPKDQENEGKFIILNTQAETLTQKISAQDNQNGFCEILVKKFPPQNKHYEFKAKISDDENGLNQSVEAKDTTYILGDDREFFQFKNQVIKGDKTTIVMRLKNYIGDEVVVLKYKDKIIGETISKNKASSYCDFYFEIDNTKEILGEFDKEKIILTAEVKGTNIKTTQDYIIDNVPPQKPVFEEKGDFIYISVPNMIEGDRVGMILPLKNNPNYNMYNQGFEKTSTSYWLFNGNIGGEIEDGKFKIAKNLLYPNSKIKAYSYDKLNNSSQEVDFEVINQIKVVEISKDTLDLNSLGLKDTNINFKGKIINGNGKEKVDLYCNNVLIKSVDVENDEWNFNLNIAKDLPKFNYKSVDFVVKIQNYDEQVTAKMTKIIDNVAPEINKFLISEDGVNFVDFDQNKTYSKSFKYFKIQINEDRSYEANQTLKFNKQTGLDYAVKSHNVKFYKDYTEANFEIDTTRLYKGENIADLYIGDRTSNKSKWELKFNYESHLEILSVHRDDTGEIKQGKLNYDSNTYTPVLKFRVDKGFDAQVFFVGNKIEIKQYDSDAKFNYYQAILKSTAYNRIEIYDKQGQKIEHQEININYTKPKLDIDKIEFDDLDGDGILNIKELDKNIKISGKAENLKDETLIFTSSNGNKILGEVKLQKDGNFEFEFDPKILEKKNDSRDYIRVNVKNIGYVEGNFQNSHQIKIDTIAPNDPKIINSDPSYTQIILSSDTQKFNLKYTKLDGTKEELTLTKTNGVWQSHSQDGVSVNSNYIYLKTDKIDKNGEISIIAFDKAGNQSNLVNSTKSTILSKLNPKDILDLDKNLIFNEKTEKTQNFNHQKDQKNDFAQTFSVDIKDEHLSDF